MSFLTIKPTLLPFTRTVRDYTARTDLTVGRVLRALRDLNLEANTVVMRSMDLVTMRARCDDLRKAVC